MYHEVARYPPPALRLYLPLTYDYYCLLNQMVYVRKGMDGVLMMTFNEIGCLMKE